MADALSPLAGRFWKALVNESPRSVRGQRLLLETTARFLGGTPKKARCRRISLSGVRAEEIRGFAHPDGRTLLYLHGGAYMMGSINTHRPLASILSRLARARGVIIDYRLAPEHPHPAAVDDALESWRALLEQGTDPQKALFAGDSAGGGLVLATLLAAKDAGLPLPGGAYCISPWTDLSTWRKSPSCVYKGVPRRVDYYLRYVGRMYTRGADPSHPYVSPVFGDYRGIPPLLIQAAEGEVLAKDAARVAEKAREAGVDVTLNLYPGNVHVLPALAGRSEEARALLKEAREFFLRRLEGG
ncbi:MAG: alpha/beta hydrolase [Deltaproteobacteria bacterium]|nr:alpha/beta hydrolase [Deltaproteobacteria bacterium]